MKTLLSNVFMLAIFSLFSLSVHADKDDFAIGMISEAKLLNDFNVFKQNFQKFSISDKELKLIAQWPETLNIDVYFGTWCHDSEREVPKLLKLLKVNKQITSTLIALDYQKKDPQGLAKENKIKFTPTFIIYRDESKKEELGRIIERPNKSLIEDINQLLL